MLLFPGFKGLLQHSDVIFWTYQTDLVFLILVFSYLVIILLMRKYPTVFINLSALKVMCHDWA